MNESCPGALGIPELRSPAAMNFHSKILQENLHHVNQVRTIFPAVPQILVWLICKIHTRGLISGTFNKNHLHRGKIWGIRLCWPFGWRSEEIERRPECV